MKIRQNHYTSLFKTQTISHLHNIQTTALPRINSGTCYGRHSREILRRKKTKPQLPAGRGLERTVQVRQEDAESTSPAHNLLNLPNHCMCCDHRQQCKHSLPPLDLVTSLQQFNTHASYTMPSTWQDHGQGARVLQSRQSPVCLTTDMCLGS